MELTTAVLVAATVVLPVVLFIWHMTSTHNTFKKMGIDTPPLGWIFGHMNLVFKYGIYDAQTITYNQFKGKKVYGWYDSRTPILVIRDLDMIKDVFVKHFNHFTDRRIFEAFLEPPFTDNLLNLTGEHWKHVRNTVSPTFSSGRVKKMSKHVERNMRLLSEFLHKKQERNEEIDISETSYCFTMNTIAGTAFGIDINTLDDPNNVFAVEGKRFTSPSDLALAVSLMLPKVAKLLKYLNSGLCIFPKKTMDFFTKIVDTAISNRKEAGQAGKVNDFLDLVMNAEKEPGESTTGGLTRSEIHGQALVFLFAGYDTVASALSFTLFTLAMHPECCQRVQEEIDEKIGKDVPNYENVQELNYLDMCINETMRMYTPALFVDRVCTEDITLQGVNIPKGMVVLIPCHGVHNDPEIWSEPEKFDPERFTPENKANRHHYAHMPFGMGPRNCIGMRLAQVELKMTIASVLQKFNLLPCDKTVYPVKLSKAQLKANDGLWVKLEARK